MDLIILELSTQNKKYEEQNQVFVTGAVLLRDQDFVYDATSDVLSFKNMQGNNWIIQHTKNIFNKNYEKIKFQA